MKTEILLIVHPGSACGSADMNLGRDGAAMQRLDMISDVNNWSGGVLVIDGDLSSELDGECSAWQEWGDAIKQALRRAERANLPSCRIEGNDASDFNQEDATRALIKDFGFTPNNNSFALSGAWYESGSGGGCVGSVRDVLVDLGFEVEVEGAMDLDLYDCEDDQDDDQKEDIPQTANLAHSVRKSRP